jgi:Tol biopolymer transport system component
VAYVTKRPGGGKRVVIQDLAGAQQLPIFDAKGIRSLRWSPSGSELLVSGTSTGDVSQTFLVSRLGGATRPLRYLPFVAWAPDGKRFAGTTLSAREIWLTDPSTGSTSSIELTGEFAFIYEIDWSPTGALLAFRSSDKSDRHAIWTVPIDGGKQQQVVQEATALYAPRFSPSGDAIYYLSGTEQARELRKIEIDGRTGEAEDESVLLLSGLQAGDHMDFSSDGKRLLYSREVSHTNLWLVNRQDSGAATTDQLTHGTFRDEIPRFSPDGTRVALIRRSRSNPNIFVMSLAERQPQQLTFLTSDIWQPVWSPDGNEIAFGTTMGDAPRVWKVDTRGGTPQPFNNTSLSRDLAWAPGSTILYQRPGNSAFHHLAPNTGDETAFMDDAGGGSADPLQFFSYMASPEYSRDGKQVAINCNCPGGEGVWVVSVSDSSSKLIHNDIETFPVGWSADGAWVYALKPATKSLMRIPTRGGTAETLLDIPFERVGDIDITPDGTRIVAAVPVTQADIWLIENFDPDLN